LVKPELFFIRAEGFNTPPFRARLLTGLHEEGWKIKRFGGRAWVL
jgi:hypothetical protein